MSSPMPTQIDACACPLCGKPNECAMEAAKLKVQDVAACWCLTVDFSPELIARVPAAAQRKACICQSCATLPPPTC